MVPFTANGEHGQPGLEAGSNVVLPWSTEPEECEPADQPSEFGIFRRLAPPEPEDYDW